MIRKLGAKPVGVGSDGDRVAIIPAMPAAQQPGRERRGSPPRGARVLTLPTATPIALLLLLVIVMVFVSSGSSAHAAQGESSFWAQNWGTGAYSRVTAQLRYSGEHVLIYVADGDEISDFTTASLGSAFDETIYPTVTDAYGTPPDPGIDGESRIIILIYDFKDVPTASISGSFNPRDIQPTTQPSFNWQSNQSEIIYLNQQAILADPEHVGAIAAHELSHLIIHYRDVMLDGSADAAPEATWLVEGLTSYAEHLCGYNAGIDAKLRSFLNDGNFNITRWVAERRNYGASYSLVRYLAERGGPEFLHALVGQPLDGTAGIDAAFRAVGAFETFSMVYDDWVLTQFLDGHPLRLSPYSMDGITVSAYADELAGDFPLLRSLEVANFGAAYVDFPAVSVGAEFQVVLDADDGAPVSAALISWDSAGMLPPAVSLFLLNSPTRSDTLHAPVGYDRHTLAVWAKGAVGESAVFEIRFSGAPNPPGGVQFMDMGGNDPYYRYAADLLSRGVISGKQVPAGSDLWYFSGQANVTRAQFAKMIVEAIDRHTLPVDHLGTPTFSDVRPVYDIYGQPGAYPFDYIEEAVALGIVNGYLDGRFRPNTNITRSQLVLMITRAAQAVGKPLPGYTGSAKVFADVSVSSPLYHPLMAAYQAGILSGSPGADGKLYFRPSSPASRNHVAKMTARLIEVLEAAG